MTLNKIPKEMLGQDVQDEFNKVGDISTLQTTNKSNVVAAVNENVAQLADIATDVNTFPGTTFTDKLKAAIATIKAGGISKRLKIPPGTFAINEQINIDTNIIIEGDGIGNTILDFSAATGTFPDGYGIYAKGNDLSILPSLSSNIVKNSTTISFSAAHGLSVGDIVIIYDSADNSFSNFRTYYKAGEFVRVKSINGNDITIDNPTFAGYTSGGTVSLYKMNPIIAIFKNFSLKAKAGTTGISIKYGYNCKFENLFGNGTEISHFNFMKCFNSQAVNVNVAEYSVSSGFGYGLSISNSQDIKVSHSDFVTSRHGLTIGGSDEVGCVPNRIIRVMHCTIGGFGSTDLGMDMHGNSEYIDFEHCSLLNGVFIRGDHVSVSHCRIRTSTQGLAVYGDELLGADILVEDNTVEVTANVPYYGVIYLPFTSNLVRINETVKVHDNKISMDIYNGMPINIYNISSTAIINVSVKDNKASCYTASPANGYLLVRAATGMAFKRVKIKDNDLINLSVWARDCNAEYYDINHNELHGSFADGIVLTANSTPVPTSELINVEGNSVEKPLNGGIQINGLNQSFTIVRMKNNISINANQSNSAASNFLTSIYVNNALLLEMNNNMFGDVFAKQTRLFSLVNIATVYEKDNINIGTVTVNYLSAITNYYSTLVSKGVTKVAYGTAAPTTGTWGVGDIVWNNAPTASGKVGWVCTAAGTPGTWKAFGAIDA